jgi:hypothetical protein
MNMSAYVETLLRFLDIAAAESLVREDIRAALDRWNDGQPHPTGSFLRAVLSNDLMAAVGCADDYNIRTLPAIMSYVYHNLVSENHGSPEKYEAWIQKHRALREAKVAET